MIPIMTYQAYIVSVRYSDIPSVIYSDIRSDILYIWHTYSVSLSGIQWYSYLLAVYLAYLLAVGKYLLEF